MHFKGIVLIFYCIYIVLLVSSTLSATKKNRSSFNYKQLMLISTVDGGVSALDLNNQGKLLWSVELDGPLVSSSITKLSYEQDGKVIRLIPSLHGGLYKFDGDAVEAVPFDAEQLLHSSFRLADNSVLVGGKDTAFTGIDATSGKILYTCNVNGCAQEQATQDTSDVFIVKRLQQTVRSIENRQGAENWNFSVGELDIEFSKGSNALLLSGSADKTVPNEQEYYFDRQDNNKDFDTLDISGLKFVVPDGTVCMVKPTNNQFILWKHKFSSAIASAWILSEGKFVKVNMFDSSKVPALGKDSAPGPLSSDVIYMGIYDKQIYIQASPSVREAVSQSINSNLQTSVSRIKYNPPRFTHRPCPSSSKYLTLSSTESPHTNSEDKSLVVSNTQDIITNTLGKHLLLCHDGPKLRKGFYFQGDLSIYSRIQKNNRKGRHTITSDEVNSSQIPLDLGEDSSLKFYIFTLLMLLVVPYLVSRYVQARYPKQSARQDLPKYFNVNDKIDSSVSCIESEYESRFLNDFEPEKCLGRGGFGVVFKARNKMDDCSYAVKRILLPHNKFSKNKVLREVRALAQLDHPSIVRYFNSWSEQPPLGWQNKKDEMLLNDLSAWSSGSVDNRTTSHHSMAELPHSSIASNYRLNAESQITDFSDKSVSSAGVSPAGNSLGFMLSKWNKESKQENDVNNSSTTWDTSNNNQSRKNDNFKGKFFQNNSCSSSDSSLEQNSSLPFQKYHNQTASIEFKDDSESNKSSEKSRCKLILDAYSPANLPKHNGSDKKESLELEHDKEDQNSTVYLYIQMQLCREDSLKEWLNNHLHNRQREECIGVFHQVVGAVEYIHQQDLIHRDLKPSNVLFSLNGTIKVGDFGLVTHAGELPAESADHEDSPDKQHTRHVGTMLYMAPEQMKSGNYTGKVDIFALGLILFELFYSFDTQMEKVKHFANVRRSIFPPDFECNFFKESALIKSMLHKHAESRPTAHCVKNDELFRVN